MATITNTALAAAAAILLATAYLAVIVVGAPFAALSFVPALLRR